MLAGRKWFDSRTDSTALQHTWAEARGDVFSRPHVQQAIDADLARQRERAELRRRALDLSDDRRREDAAKARRKRAHDAVEANRKADSRQASKRAVAMLTRILRSDAQNEHDRVFQALQRAGSRPLDLLMLEPDDESSDEDNHPRVGTSAVPVVPHVATADLEDNEGVDDDAMDVDDEGVPDEEGLDEDSDDGDMVLRLSGDVAKEPVDEDEVMRDTIVA